jgi:pyrrolysine biosynthesis protein PylC
MTMSVAIIGGNLQGVEATYLAKKAGWEVLLIDKNPQAAASLMCDRFLPLTLTAKTDPPEFLKQVELIIPALENKRALGVLKEWSLETGIPMAFDMEAHAISSSKRKSNQLFKEININTPQSWPQCDFPIVVKPDGGSGSQGVKIIHCERELSSHFPMKDALHQMVTQAYLEGPAYSIEVIGFPGHYRPLQVTELHMDRDYDCKRVIAPAGLDSARVMEFEQIATRIAERIQLRGVMDVEVILHDGQLKTLEIDARLPSQTPTAVFHSMGINMLKLLGELFLTGKMNINHIKQPETTIYEHVKVKENSIEVKGERIMSGVGSLKLQQGLFGAHEVISNFHPNLKEWVATLILTGKNMEEVVGRRQQAYDNIHNRAEQIAKGIQ